MASGRKSRAAAMAALAARSDGSGSPPEKTSTTMPGLAQRCVDRIEQARLEQDRIGDDEDATGAETAGDVAELERRRCGRRPVGRRNERSRWCA